MTFDPHALNGDNDQLIDMEAGIYSLNYLRRYVVQHGGMPPEIEATMIDGTEKLMRRVMEARAQEFRQRGEQPPELLWTAEELADLNETISAARRDGNEELAAYWENIRDIRVPIADWEDLRPGR